MTIRIIHIFFSKVFNSLPLKKTVFYIYLIHYCQSFPCMIIISMC